MFVQRHCKATPYQICADGALPTREGDFKGSALSSVSQSLRGLLCLHPASLREPPSATPEACQLPLQEGAKA